MRLLIRAMVFCLLVVGIVSAQEPASEPPSATPAADNDGVDDDSGRIPLPELGRESEALRQRAGEISAWLAIGRDDEEWLAELAAFLADVDEQGVEFDRFDTDSLDRLHLNELGEQWRGFARRISSYQEAFSSYASEIEATMAELEAKQLRWLRTREHLAATDASSVALVDVDNGLAMIEQLLSKLIDHRRPIAAMQSALTQQSLKVSDVRDRIDEVERDIRDNLTRIDAPPIWRLGDLPSGLKSWEFTAELASETVRRFLRVQLGSLLAHVLALVLAIATAYWWARQLSTLAIQDDQALAVLRSWLEHPVTVGVFVAVLASDVFYASLPVLISSALWLLLIVAAVRLLAAHSLGALRLPGMLLVAMVVIESMLSQIASPSIGSRLLLLLENVLLLWVTAGIARRLPFNATGSAWRVVAGLMTRALPVIGAIALVANVIGAVSLSIWLVRGSVLTLLTGLVVLVGVVLAEGFFTHYLRHRQARIPVMIQQQARRLETPLRLSIRLFAFVVWLDNALAAFGLREQGRQWVSDLLTTPVAMGSLSISLSQVLGFVLVLGFSLILARVIRLLLEQQVLADLTLPRGVASAISMISRYVVVALGFLAALSVAGVNLSQVGIIIGALSVGIGLGLQNVVGNFVSGLILVFERPIQSGDVVQVGPLLGKVQEIGVRSSRVQTFEGSEVILPNSDLVTREVTNWTLSDSRRRLDIRVVTDLAAKPRDIVSLLETVVDDKDYVLPDPKPIVLFEGAEQGYFVFILRFWVVFADSIRAKNELALEAYELLDEHGVGLPDPIVSPGRPRSRR